ncbi:hypothetical protein TRFO_23914 [Tritrichomonas foetus]|uniref:Uncharacterized protein n=1 Tax=Tritrichomonas foetus TaxID=1144522 RepID=A0A1J4K8L1_9EUKA|nr:hypothetical protein TRFO_23914 [Tritrichomonas foetus]|eukprot:OHT07743.1 hypothetical protein TRFO_23914 [Tritrichomonas foetus]
MALNINYKSNLKLPCEYFILNIYVEYPDLILSLGSLSHLLCYLLHSFPLDLAQQELVNYVCQKQPQQVAKYWCGLPLEEKDKIEKFLDVKNVLKNKRKTNRNKKNGGNHLEKNILTQIFEIFDKGDASDLNECLTLIDNYSDQLSDCIMKFNDIFDYSFYLKFVRFISKCKNNDIDNNSNLVENICAKYFGDSQLLIFLGNDWISHDLINGTAKIIWSSPSSLLQGSDKYLLNLYQVFKGSKGSTRYDIVKIFIAIEYVTNVSIFNFPDVIEPYRGLIESMIDQFQVDS